MELSDLPEAILVTETAELESLVRHLESQPIIAVDTESNSLYAYQEQVCLIQFTTPANDFLLDPLALPDLTRLAPVFANPEIEKVFHASEYDLICLKRDFDFVFANLFDTMLAASTLGRDEIGLGSILKAEFNVELDKRYQRADWGQRPLPRELLTYARFDTHFLIPLRDRLKAQLQERGRWPLAAEDFARLDRLSGIDLESNGNGGRVPLAAFSRVKGVHDLDPQQLAILNELCRYRDQVARSLDRPLFKVMGDETLMAIASGAPKDLNDLRRLPGMSKGQIHRHGYALLQAVERGRRATPLSLPRAPRPDERFLMRLENLRQWRKEAARAIGVKSDVILSRDLLHAVAEQNPKTRPELAAILYDVPYRLEQYGDQILGVLQNNHGSM